MAIETALEDVKVKEELKRGPDLEEEDRSKVVEGEGKDSAQRWQILSEELLGACYFSKTCL